MARLIEIEPHLQHIPRIRSVDIDGARQHMPARPPVLDRLHIPQFLLDLRRRDTRPLQPSGLEVSTVRTRT